MKEGNFSRVESDALAQVVAGAHMLDVNAGIPLADEPALLAKAIQLVQSITDVPLSIDSSIIAALEAGLAVYQGKALVNSVTGEEANLERVLPLVAKYGAAVVAISNDETGISMDPDERFAVAKKIVNHAADYGIPSRNNITGTFLAMAIGAGMTSAIMNPMHPEVKTLVMAADVLVGNDENCSAWIRANRDPNEVNADRAARNSRGRRKTE